jgi:hypothetical protein
MTLVTSSMTCFGRHATVISYAYTLRGILLSCGRKHFLVKFMGINLVKIKIEIKIKLVPSFCSPDLYCCIVAVVCCPCLFLSVNIFLLHLLLLIMFGYAWWLNENC